MYNKRLTKNMGFMLATLVLTQTGLSAYVPEKTSNKYASYKVQTQAMQPIRNLDEKDEKVAENEHLILYVNKQDLSIKVYDKTADYYYSSNDINPEGLNSYWMNYVNSPLTIKTINSKMQVKQETIFDSPKSKKRVTKMDDSGFAAELYFGDSQITISYEVILDGEDIIFSIKDESIKEEATSKIVAEQKKEQEALEGRTDLSVKEKALLKGKKSDDSYDLYGVQMYPFFGAVGAGEQDGYTFIPDGSGALMRFDETYNNINAPYEQPYLEHDISIGSAGQSAGYNTNYDQSLLMPIYGMVHGVDQAGFLSISEMGYENAYLLSYPAGLFTDYYFTTTEYRYNGISQQKLSATQNIAVKLDERLHYDIQERVHFLQGNEANYTGQALYYKNYLLGKDALNTVEVTSSPLVVTTAMGAVEKGIFMNKVHDFTTTDEVVGMDDYFKANGIESVDYILKDVTKDLYTGKFSDRAKVQTKLEGKYSFEEMNTYLRDNGSRAFVDVELTEGKGNINPDKYTVRGADDNYNVFKYPMGGKTLESVLLNAAGVQEVADLHTELLDTYGFAGINHDFGIGMPLLYTNNSKSGIEARDKMLQANQEALGKTGEVAAVAGGLAPFYTFKELDASQHTPVYTTQYSYITDTIPFYQIVLAGNIPMYATPINNETDLTEAFLRSIEYNVYPSFQVMDVESDELPPLYFSPSGKTKNTMLLSDWQQEIVTFYKDVDAILQQVQNESIVSHKAIAPSVMEVKYSNGKTIVVNYSNQDFNHNGVTVEKRGCSIR